MPLNPKDFNLIRQLVNKRSAIVLDNGKEALVESRLSILARKEGIDTIAELLNRLRSCTASRLHDKVVEVMTTNETLFFRDIYPFDVLCSIIIPELLEKRKTENRLHIWSAGCSSGQEPYSIAMLLKEHFAHHTNWSFRINACDISKEMVARAREGRYSQFEINRGLPAPLLVKYFHQKGVDWQLREDIRRMVEYDDINLAAPQWPMMPSMDIIFMRNVLIYFDIETKKQILHKVRRLLRPDGYLFLGTAETTLNLDDSFDRKQYEKAWCYRPLIQPG